MKILVLTNLFPSPWDPQRGAFNRQQFERLGELHDVDVLTAIDFRDHLRGAHGEVNISRLNTDHFVFFYPPRFGRFLHAMCWLICLLWQRGKTLAASQYDCILVSWAYPDAVAVRWLARWLRVPYVVKVHGSDLNVQAERILLRPQIRSALIHASAVIAVSRALASKAVDLDVHNSRLHVLYNGVDTHLFTPEHREASRAKLGLSTYSPLILFVGNLKETKGCMDLLEAFPALLAIHPRARLVFVGSGACGELLLKRALELGCIDHVEQVGAVKHDALVDWFRSADLLCLPSHNEGVPNVVLEAMACGTPVVASHVGGIPEVLPAYAGILVPPKKPRQLAAALIEASRRDWDAARIASHAATFRWDDNIRHLDGILHEAARIPAMPAGASA